ncbi:hypothetical protein HYH03_015299 [Edaphochlamys debaryana]|uniref:MYND-type domain-containing protein n=1 Tax=Edaphochlamys debaryana TaxID=47281 RepID=A0A835XPL3_9CHLO|nr:hypothetical protein HYH03_015299 [Edaphochlamys debaryana]|eukprot:KAG2485976.1 hypothetical protein HYH03_015299 [Edaphochlamys debaryana]
MECAERQRRVHMSWRIEEEGQRSQELRAAKAALEQARQEMGYRSGGGRRPRVGPEAMQLRLRWLERCAAAGVPAWTLRLLRALPAPIAAACRTTASSDTLVIAVDISQLTVYSAGLCVTSYHEPLLNLLEEDYSTYATHIRTHAAPFTSADFLSALSRAASSAADLARHLQLPATQAHIATHRAANVPLAVSSATTAVGFTVFAGHSLLLASSLLQKEAYTAGPLPPLVPRLAAAVRDSQLPAGVARALMTCAALDSTAVPGQGGGGAGSTGPEAQTAGVPVWPAVPDSVRALAVLTETATLWKQAGVGPGPGAGCNLEDACGPGSFAHHSNTLMASLARAAARTAEAMCRLSRGEGLAGAYTPEQRRRLFRSKTCWSHLLPPPSPAALEELPHWMEGATTANLATTLVDGVQRLFWTAAGTWCEPLTASHHEALAASLHRSGLAASLDHALRLAFAAADRAAAPGASERDRRLAEAQDCLLLSACDLLSVLTPPCGSPAAFDVGGVALTFAKRASLVARGLEAGAAAGGGPTGAVPACLRRGPRDSSPRSLAALLGRCGAVLKGAAGPASGGGAPEGELEAYFFQAASRLAAQLGADAAGCELVSASSVPPPAVQARLYAGPALAECLAHVSALCSTPGSLAPARLLACQPHRLIAAACKLLLAWRSAAHPSLSARVRRWLLVPTGGREEAAGCGGSSVADAPEGTGESGPEAETAGAEAEQGCLAQAWGEGWRSYDGWRLADGSSFPLPLLRLARGGGASGRGAEGEAGADAACRSGAMELLAWAESVEAGGSPPPPQLPEGLILDPGDASSPEALRAAAAVLQSTLPPPLAAPPEGRALPKLRVCGFTGCASFGGRSEGGLALRQCGGCRAVRYCGPGCQRAHWREGHRGECGALAEAAEVLTRASGAGV